MSKNVTKVSFTSGLWRYQGQAAWYFVTLTPAAAASIRSLLVGHPRRPGFGSVRVMATIGKTTWPSSIFPDRSADSYLLPVKVAVRRQEDLSEEQQITVRLQVVG